MYLPPVSNTLFVMDHSDAVRVYSEGFTLPETAAKTGLSLHTVRMAVIAAGAMRTRSESYLLRGENQTEKKCPRCEETKPLDEFHVRRLPSGRLGPHGYCKPCNLTANREWKYGEGVEEFQARVEAQNGLCAICGQHMALPQQDHDHATNALRDVLCPNCNRGLGYFADDPERLLAAAAYVIKHRGGQ